MKHCHLLVFQVFDCETSIHVRVAYRQESCYNCWIRVLFAQDVCKVPSQYCQCKT